MPILRRIALALAVSSGLLLPLCAGAADVDSVNLASTWFTFDTSYLRLSDSGNEYESGTQNVETLLQSVVRIILIGISVIAAIGTIVAGFMLIFAGGDSSQATQARQIIVYNSIAIVMALMAYSIIQLVSWLLTNS